MMMMLTQNLDFEECNSLPADLRNYKSHFVVNAAFNFGLQGKKENTISDRIIIRYNFVILTVIA